MILVANEQGVPIVSLVWGYSPICGKQQTHGVARLYYRVLGGKTAMEAW